MSNIINSESSPFVFAYLNTPVTNATGNGTNYTVKFDTIIAGSGYSTSTGIFTAPVAGNYLISTSIFLNNIISSANNNLTSIVVNSTAYRLMDGAMNALKDPSNNYLTYGSISSIFLNVNDQVYINAFVNNGSSAVVGISGGSSPYQTWIFIKYLS